MKRFISIFFVALSVTGMLFLSTVPHHHHGEKICFSSECCLSHSHADTDDEHDESDCVLSHSLYLFDADHNQVRTPSADILRLHVFAAAVVPLIQRTEFIPQITETDYGDFVAAPYHRFAESVRALRAPPVA